MRAPNVGPHSWECGYESAIGCSTVIYSASTVNDQARNKLCELLSQQGQSLLTLGRTCEMLISQSCAEYPEEAKALIQVEKQGIALEMVNAADELSREKMAEGWVQRLVDRGSLNDPEARWALNAWTGALKGPSVQQNQPPAGPAWSEANFEAATRTPAGARVGVLTRLLVDWFFCFPITTCLLLSLILSGLLWLIRWSFCR